MACPDPKFSIVANTWVKQMHFAKAGDINEGHKHNFDHQTLLAKGSVKIKVNGQETDFVAPHIIFIGAGHEHEMVALRDGDQVEDIIDPRDVPNGVTPLVQGDERKLIPAHLV